jgi:hypothetical protein
MSEPIQLTAYFEPLSVSNQPPSIIASDYVAGFRDADGAVWGLHVPVPADVVELAVMKRAAFSIGLEPDGRICLRSDGLNEIAWENAAKQGCLPMARLPELVSACLDPAELRREDSPSRDLERLRNDLIEALAIINATLKTLQTSRR